MFLELVPVIEKAEKVDSIQSKLTSLGPRFVVNSMRDFMSFCVCFKKCSKCEAEGDDFLFKVKVPYRNMSLIVKTGALWLI